MTLYRYEHDPATMINLDSESHILQDQQTRLHRISAALARDLSVITDEIVRRAMPTEEELTKKRMG